VLDRRQRELDLVAQRYGELERPDDCSWLVIARWALPPGWSKAETAVLVPVPPGYPETPPDNFYTDPDLNLAGGGTPANTSGHLEHAGRTWRQFSWHFVDANEWQPHPEIEKGHNLLTFMLGVEQRLSDVS
jgi:hypothetical protein